MVVKAAQDLWSDYLFLTREMGKFLAKGDMDTFHILIEQRSQLQKLIDDQGDRTFTASAEGRKILGLIRDLDIGLKQGLNSRYHRSKQRDNLERSYAGGMAAATGSLMNRKG
jgi:hypothetical protein